MRRFTIFLVLTVLSLFTGTIVSAQETPNVLTANYRSILSVVNTGVTQIDESAAFPLSGQTLVSQNFIATDGLNSVVLEAGGVASRAMPASAQMDLESAKQDDGTVFTTYTTEISDGSIGDVIFFPVLPVANDAFYFGLNSPGRIITINIGVAGVHDMTLEYEYYNGSTWTALSNVEDKTDEFETAGVNTLNYDLPTDWEESTIDSVLSYWIRVRVDTFTSVTTAVLGTQAWWESGSWFVYVDTIGQNEQLNYSLYLGGTPNLSTQHEIFPGSEGIVTGDSATIELGTDPYTITMIGSFNTDSSGGSYLLKTGAIELDNPSSGTIRLRVQDGVSTNTISIGSIPSGVYTIGMSSDGDTQSLSISGANGSGSGSTGALSITDNANDWIWLDGDTSIYVDSIVISLPSIINNWNRSGDFSTDGTITGTAEYLDTSIISTIGNSPIIAQGSTMHGGNLWIMDTNDLYELDETDATSTISNCVVANTGAAAVTSDATNLWYISAAATDVIEINTSCVLQSQFDIAAITPNANGIAYNTDTSRLAVFSSPAGTATMSVYQTNGTQDSSVAITGMSGITPVAAEYYAGSYYVVAWNSGNAAYEFWRMTTATNGVRLYSIRTDMYGYSGIDNTVGSILPIQPGNFPFASAEFAMDSSGTIWSYTNLLTVSASIWYQDILTYTLDDLLAAHVRVENDYQRNIPHWTDFDDVSGQRSGLQTVDPFYGNYGVVFSRTSAGWGDTQQTVTGFTPGNTYSFGVVVDCGGEFNELNVQWQESDGTPIGSLLQDQRSGCGALTQLALDAEVAPALATQVVLEIQHYCTGTCSGLDYSYWDGVQAIEALAVEAFPTTTTNLVQNPSFEMLYETGTTWESNSISLGTVTDVASTIISWTKTIPDDSSLLVETSINAGGQWDEATSGNPIPLISVNDDLSGLSLLVRITFNPSTDQESTPELLTLALSVLDASDTSLDYRLLDLPSLTLTDQGPNGNDGAFSFPLASTSILSATTGALITTNLAGSVQDEILGAPEVVDEITPTDVTGSNFDGSTLPLNGVWVALSNISGGDVPAIFFWVVGATIITLGAGFLTFMFTASLAWTAGVMALFLLGFSNLGGGLFPMWIFLFFGMMAMASAVFIKVKSL